jgi:hypothetical protein
LIENLEISTSRAGNAETIALKTAAGSDPSGSDKIRIGFRDATAGTGAYSVLEISAATSITISSGSTLGATSATIFRLWLVGFNDASTFRLGVIKCALTDGVYGLQDNVLESSTAEGGAGAADSSGVIYTGTGVTSKAMRVLGYLEYTLTTAGTWDAAPSLVNIYSQGDRLPGETVQMKRTVDTSARSVVGASLAASGLSVTITPKSAANAVDLSFDAMVGRSALGEVNISFYRGTTSLIPSGVAGSGRLTVNGNNYAHSHSNRCLDFPVTASAVTYNLYMTSTAAGVTAWLGQRGDGWGGVLAPNLLGATEIMV